ncbi:MAG: choice-of-anchor L domain-containing protein [Bacteroidales bacterium]|nr:choice-of-anchor L domain-containing protein [Bacteroidales bacterium]
MRKLLQLLLLLFTLPTFSCVLTVNMIDTYGDGWNGNSITINVNGTAVLTNITIASGSTGTYTFNANTGDVVTISYNNSGSWDYENEYTITNENGAEVFEDGQGGVDPTGGTFTVDCSATPPPPPANDMPCDAISLDPITTNCNYQQFTTDMALNLSGVPNPTCGSFAGGDVWFSAVVPASGRLTVSITAAGMIEGDIAIYSGPNCNTLTQVRCMASSWAVPMPSINIVTGDGLAGQTVWIRVWEPNNDNQGTFNICAFETPPPPANNEPCGGIPIPVNVDCNFSTYSTMSATGSTIPNPSCAWSYAGGDVWFTAVVPASGRLAVQLGAAMMTDAGIAIYSGPDCTTLTELRCQESTWGMPTTTYVFELDGLAGQTVWIRVWEPDNDNQGTFNICAFEPDPMLEVTTTTYTYDELITEVLITGCLQAFNVEYDGPDYSIGAFSHGTSFGMESGVIMGSGPVVEITGDNSVMDNGWITSNTNVQNDVADISSDNGGSTNINDQVIIEFDFIPSSDLTEFDFVFASDEYPGFEHTQYNDVFAFFLSGPGITGPYTDNAINVALVPGTTDVPITISTVNGTDNAAYFAQYVTAGEMPSTGGFTVPITAYLSGLTPCETYHIKFVIADAADGILNSYVMFEAGSFSSGGDVLMSHYASVGNSNEVYEGCENYWVFSRVDTTSNDSLQVVLQISGSAENGVDITPFPASFWLVPGQNSDTIYYSALIDNIAEGTEYIVFALENGCPCSVTTTNDTIWVYDNFDLQAEISNDVLSCGSEAINLNSFINPALDPSIVTWIWSTGATTQNITVNPLSTTTYYVTVSDPCNQTTELSVTVTIVPELSASFTLADSVCAGETTTLTFTGFSGPDATYTWNFDGATVISGSGTGPFELMWTNTGNRNISLLISDNGCTSTANATIVVSAVPTTPFIIGEILCAGGSMNVTYTGTASSTATYNWDFDGATIISGSGQGPYQITWNTPGNYTIYLNSVSENGCTSLSTTSSPVFVPESLVLTLATQDASCNGLCNGSVTATVEGGVER